MMGPKRNVSSDVDKNTAEALNIESDTEEENLRRTIQQLEDRLKLTTDERNREKDRASARERELDALSNTLTRQERSSAAERDALVREYQGRINEMMATRDLVATLSETQSNQETSALDSRAHDRGTLRPTVQQNQHNGSHGVLNGERGRVQMRANYDVPMPRQALFDGKTTWESFFQPFEALAVACKWDQNEKLFRLTSCLRGDAAEYAFGQLPQDKLADFSQLEKALEARYKEKRTSSSYVAELENRRMQIKEKLADYVADIKRLVIKGYPTADGQTREKINVRHFLKGLPDQQMAVAVGMREPATIDEARQILEMYNSLKDEVKGNRVRFVQPGENPSGDAQYVTEKRLREFGAELKSNIGKKIDSLSQKLDKNNGAGGRARSPVPLVPDHGNKPLVDQPKRKVRCYFCSEENHISRYCPKKLSRGNLNRNSGANNPGN